MGDKDEHFVNKIVVFYCRTFFSSASTPISAFLSSRILCPPNIDRKLPVLMKYLVTAQEISNRQIKIFGKDEVTGSNPVISSIETDL